MPQQLQHIQQLFLDSLYRQDTQLQSYLLPRRRGVADQIATYHHSILGGITKALAQTFPVTLRLLGETFFNALCKRYILTHYSNSPDLNDYGEDLIQFIASFPATQSLPYLSDIAALEWAWHRAFIGNDESWEDISALTSLPTEQLLQTRLILPGDASILSSPFPIQLIWRVNQDDYTGESNVSLDEGGVKLFVFRRNLELHMDVLDESEWNWLQAIQQGQPLGVILAQETLSPTTLTRLLQRNYIRAYRS